MAGRCKIKLILGVDKEPRKRSFRALEGGSRTKRKSTRTRMRNAPQSKSSTRANKSAPTMGK